MRRQRALWTAAATVVAIILTIGGPQSPAAVADSEQLYVYRVSAGSDAAAQQLFRAGFDVLENRSGADLFVLGDAETARTLRAAGFRPAVHEKLRPTSWRAPSTRLVPGAKAPTLAPIDETYYGGYHTVNAQYAHLTRSQPTTPTWPPWSTTATPTSRPATRRPGTTSRRSA